MNKASIKSNVETDIIYPRLKEPQANILGLVTVLENTHKLLSNRESGDGRYDIQLGPKSSDLPGIIIELKSTAKASDNLNDLATKAYKQILDKKYDTELLARNVHTIYKYGIAFRGKEAEVVSD